MERRVIYFNVVELIGEYGIVKSKEQLVWNNGKVFSTKVFYDVALNQGYGDIVASFNNVGEARAWAKENELSTT